MIDRYTYEVGDFEMIDDTFHFYGEFPYATVIYVDKKYAIAQIPSGSFFVENHANPNRYNAIPRETVEKLIGECPNLGKYDGFLDLNFSGIPYKKEELEFLIYDKFGNSLDYRFIENIGYYIAPCGTQAVNMVILAKVFGEPAEGQRAFPVDESFLRKNGLSPLGNYYWLSVPEAKHHELQDWVEINKGDYPDGDYSHIEGFVIYSFANIAVVQINGDQFCSNIKNGAFKLISYEELSQKPGFVPFFKPEEGDYFVELNQATGESDEILMPYTVTVDGTSFKGIIKAYLFDRDANLLGRLISIDRSDNTTDVQKLTESLKDKEIMMNDLMENLGNGPMYYVPLSDGEEIKFYRG